MTKEKLPNLCDTVRVRMPARNRSDVTQNPPKPGSGQHQVLSDLTHSATTPAGSNFTHRPRRYERQSGNAQISKTSGSPPVNPPPAAVEPANAALADGTHHGSRHHGSSQPDSTSMHRTRANYVPSRSIPHSVSPAPSTGDPPSRASEAGTPIATAHDGGFVGGPSSTVAPVDGDHGQALATTVGNAPAPRIVTRNKSRTSTLTAGSLSVNATPAYAVPPAALPDSGIATISESAVKPPRSRARAPRWLSGKGKGTKEYSIKGCIALRLKKDQYETLFVWEDDKPSWVRLSYNWDRDEVAGLMQFIGPNMRPYTYNFPEGFWNRGLDRNSWRQRLKVVREEAKQEFPDVARDLDEYERRGFEGLVGDEDEEDVKDEKAEQKDHQAQDCVQGQDGHQPPDGPKDKADVAEPTAGNKSATKPSSNPEKPSAKPQPTKSNSKKRRRSMQTAAAVELSDSESQKSSGKPPKRRKKGGCE